MGKIIDNEKMELISFNGKLDIILRYINKKRVCFCDFIELIKEDLLKRLSKIRGFIDYNPYDDDGIFDIYDEKSDHIYFDIIFESYVDENIIGGIEFTRNKNFGVNGIYVDKFVKEVLKIANKNYEEYINSIEYEDDEDYKVYIDNLYHDKECDINYFDKNFYCFFSRVYFICRSL